MQQKGAPSLDSSMALCFFADYRFILCSQQNGAEDPACGLLLCPYLVNVYAGSIKQMPQVVRAVGEPGF